MEDDLLFQKITDTVKGSFLLDFHLTNREEMAEDAK